MHTSEEEKGVGFCKRERGNEITRIEKRKGEGDASESEVKKDVARLANDLRRRSWGGRKMRGEKSDEREPNWKKNDLMGGSRALRLNIETGFGITRTRNMSERDTKESEQRNHLSLPPNHLLATPTHSIFPP